MRKPTVAAIRRDLKRLNRELYKLAETSRDKGRSWRLACAADEITTLRAVDLHRMR